MVNIPGVDYAWSHPGGAAIQAAGKRFACRYLGQDKTKILKRDEADDLAAHDVWSVVVYEDAADRSLGGRSVGIGDAQRGLAQARAAGMPDNRPIFFAVDFDAKESQQPAINDYLDGAASVIGREWTGIYGGYWPLKRALDGGHATWGWQTVGWSGSNRDSRAVILQPATTVKLNSVTCDNDTALADDYGQWMPGILPAEADMAFTADDKKFITDSLTTALATERPKLADAVWKIRLISPTATDPNSNTRLTGDFLRYNDQQTASLTTLINAVGSADSQKASTVLSALTQLQDAVETLSANVTDPSGWLSMLQTELSQYTVSFEKKED